MKGEVRLLKAGLTTSIQDFGRVGYAKYGVPRSGVMDQKAYFFANALLGNDEKSPVIEWAMIPPKLQFFEPARIVCTGAVVVPNINGIPKKMYQILEVPAGAIVTFNFVGKGVYGYIAIMGGFCCKKVLGSCSMYPPITTQKILKKEDRLLYKISDKMVSKHSVIKPQETCFTTQLLQVFPGPEFELLPKEAQLFLEQKLFTVSGTISRMGIQLIERLANDMSSILTGPVLPGTVQLTSSGLLMILMRDCQVTGGYPRILQLTDEAINILSQKQTGDHILFKLII